MYVSMLYPPVQMIDSCVLADFLIELPNYIGCKNFSIAYWFTKINNCAQCIKYESLL